MTKDKVNLKVHVDVKNGMGLNRVEFCEELIKAEELINRCSKLRFHFQVEPQVWHSQRYVEKPEFPPDRVDETKIRNAIARMALVLIGLIVLICVLSYYYLKLKK